ncbi:MAG: ATP-dependent DNA helicase RecG [Candidatus Daviesbacteria bacterium GW2011_GWA1_41_61]|uniref:ATP-dependent DNA helicase RecG n=1 Tax=Candidatus Daviesbacteria bacterium GW2011_GWA2_40_9 TaxID=1618424 RepID=A0A0G0U438_9BACT|nr:MAG: ATP-dependent DNA helicase RecG, ATP-dependent DNA helicase RecG [Candidatus Daviesbacteria bacterium GW2011_GWC1_40_9]KKR83834.1 MAG: ATP-dependent DNA helicase RecG [Candidatus Daviesbacteria bacterium GW2011_GWA2_40_9]KKR93443.1 MAG: ATP-dependent DNA helicase RecG [Candidatus Daviesbacteria bacterium GW2011_GWB1_41_15]KKS15008.1 MAG: ATP-dependent DNA helicase RecG [Candidatus Daviesbacteria bacterium GW2011_GWA1_41_61]
MELNTPLSGLPGIGYTLAKRLIRLELFKVEDLINHYPFRYDDFSKVSKISEVKVGETVTLEGEVWSIKNTYTRFRKVLTKATLNDSTGSMELIWFNQSWLTKNIKVGEKIRASGKIDRFGSKTTMVAPDWEKVEEGKVNLHTGRLVPVYPETYGLTSKWLRQKIASLLPRALFQIGDPLPNSIKDEMLPLPEALNLIHFPQTFDDVAKAKKRLSFDELFYIQLATQKARLDWQQKQTIKPLKIDQEKINRFVKNLPFELTSAQKKVTQEIIDDLQKGHPMNRLVQGDVGSGKTVVAAIIIYLTYLNGLNSLLMAPTEILAFQHCQTLTNLLAPYGLEVGIYTGSRKILQGSSHVIVGTHALLSKTLEIDNIGLIVIDEQQRFGVEQRTLLRSKAKIPHFLTMTATPIPRTVALTIHGDLDMSVIDELPKGRKEVRTHFVPAYKRADAYKFIEAQVKEGKQVYIITPLIEESETILSAKAAKVEFERLKKEVFSHLRLGLLHGKLKSKDKEEVLNQFKDAQIDILVSTSVVEVGVDVPNATIMLIEGGERFGLAQLHQLRGRVGRGSEQSYTFLFSEEENASAINRLKNLEHIHDGLKLSEIDLKIRGSGEIFGTRQSGRWNLKIASFSNLSLIEKSREAATKILEQNPDLDKYPKLRAKLSSLAQTVSPD